VDDRKDENKDGMNLTGRTKESRPDDAKEEQSPKGIKPGPATNEEDDAKKEQSPKGLKPGPATNEDESRDEKRAPQRTPAPEAKPETKGKKETDLAKTLADADKFLNEQSMKKLDNPLEAQKQAEFEKEGEVSAILEINGGSGLPFEAGLMGLGVFFVVLGAALCVVSSRKSNGLQYGLLSQEEV